MGHLEFRVVVPIFGYTHLLDQLQTRIEQALHPLFTRFQVIYVEDGGTEASWARVQDLARRCPQARGLRLTRNWGQQSAIAAGLEQCRGHWTAVMDGDLQDPPEMLPRFWQQAEQGYDLVLAARRDSGQGRVRNFFGLLYHSLLQGRWNPPRYSCFSLLGPGVLAQYLGDPRRSEFFLSILLDLPVKRQVIVYDREDTGVSTYSYAKLVKLALRKLSQRYRWAMKTPHPVRPCFEIAEVTPGHD
jgi:dolichol-phosphate mannosyltransferase